MSEISVKPYLSFAPGAEFKFGDEGTSFEVHDRAYATKLGADLNTDDGWHVNLEARTKERTVDLHTATVAKTAGDWHVRAGLFLDTRKVDTLANKPFQGHADADLNFRSTTVDLNPKHDGAMVEKRFRSELLPDASQVVVAARVATPTKDAPHAGGSVAVVVNTPRVQAGVMVTQSPVTRSVGALASVEVKNLKLKAIVAHNATEQGTAVTLSHQHVSGPYTVLSQVQVEFKPGDTVASGAFAGLRKFNDNATAFATLTLENSEAGTGGKGLLGVRFKI